MSYQIVLCPGSKSIRAADGLHLGLNTKSGLLDAYLIRNSFHDAKALLIRVPLTEKNTEALNITTTTRFKNLIKNQKEWAVPPFKIQPWVLRKGGAFTRLGRFPENSLQFDSQQTATLFSSETFDPSCQMFIPKGCGKVRSSDPRHRENWPIKIHTSGAAVREANETERAFPIVPWTDYALGNLDLWIEQFRCWCNGLRIPTEILGADD